MNWKVFCAVLAALIAALPASASSWTISESSRVAVAGARVPAQAPALVQHFPAGSIDLASALNARGFSAGLAADASGNLYVAFTNQSLAAEIAVFARDGTLLRRWDPKGGRTVGNPSQIAIGPDGLVYIRNRNEGIIRVFTPAGVPVRTFGGTLSANNTGDLEIDAAGNVYTIDLSRIVKFSPDGQIVAQFEPVPGIHSDRLTGLALMPDGSMFVEVDPSLTGLPEPPPTLLRLDAGGQRLQTFNPNLGLPGNFIDVEFANGILYFVGSAVRAGVAHVGLASFTPQGMLIDFVVGRSPGPVAVHDDNVYAPGLDIHAPTQSARGPAAHRGDTIIGTINKQPVYAPPPGLEPFVETEDCPGSRLGRDSNRGAVLLVDLDVAPGCRIVFLDRFRPPCPPGTAQRVPDALLIGGNEVPHDPRSRPGIDIDTNPNPPRRGHYLRRVNRDPDVVLEFEYVPDKALEGPVTVRYACSRLGVGISSYAYEYKGKLELKDPSGNVLDAKTGRPIDRATVRLEFAPRKEGPFGIPSLVGISPQVNPQVTRRDGFFGWDVAPGFWRLRITAFGYRPLTSPVYGVPPEVTGLRLRMRPDPRQQRLIIDPRAGRVGEVRVGMRARRTRVAGLKVRIAGGRVGSITVVAKRFRTIEGVSRGSRDVALFSAYPAQTRVLKRGARPTKFRVGKGTFTLRKGRVATITLGR